MTIKPLVDITIGILIFIIGFQIVLGIIRNLVLINDRRKTFCLNFYFEMESYPTRKEQWELRKFWLY